MKTSQLPEFDLTTFLPYRVAVAAQILSDGLARRYRDNFGISVPEWRVLVHLAQSCNVSVRDIEVRAAMEKSKVSRAATRLEEAGYIAKAVNTSDRRLVQLSLTAKGRSLMAELLPIAIRYQNEIETRMAETLTGLETGLDRLLGARE